MTILYLYISTKYHITFTLCNIALHQKTGLSNNHSDVPLKHTPNIQFQEESIYFGKNTFPINLRFLIQFIILIVIATSILYQLYEIIFIKYNIKVIKCQIKRTLLHHIRFKCYNIVKINFKRGCDKNVLTIFNEGNRAFHESKKCGKFN